MTFQNLKIEKLDSGVAVIRFINTEKLNPLDLATGQELTTALEDLKGDETIRALLITGSGRSFSAGGDIKGMKRSIEENKTAEYMDELTKLLYGIGHDLRKFPKPIVAAVNGYAMGAGMNLALCCDLIIASEKARFAQSFSKLALIPGFGGTYLLSRQIPWAKAAEFCFFGDMISAQELLELGLINKVVSPDQLEQVALEYAERLAKGPTLAYARTKDLFMKARTKAFDVHLEDERKVQVESGKTEDYRIGVIALNEKRKPNFVGK